MKKTFIALLFLSSGFSCAFAQDKSTPAQDVPNPNPGKFRFEERIHDYGEVEEGPFAECDFEFKNVGKSPILITEAHGSCGCTVPKWPKEPILPKHKGIIHVTYNTKGRVGPINKDVFITSNADEKLIKLHIKGFVSPKPAEKEKSNIPPPPPAAPPAPPAPPQPAN